MNILIINAHWNNRGDEAALRAMIDVLAEEYPESTIKVLILDSYIKQFRYSGKITCESVKYPRTRDYLLQVPLFLVSKGKIVFSDRVKRFKKLVVEADLVIHGPGGPSIGDIYYNDEKAYLYRLWSVMVLKKPYVMYAPSMGPFNIDKHKFRNMIRRKILNGASVFCLREPISRKYVEELGGVQTPTVTLDSAFQYPIDKHKYEKELQEYSKLKQFVDSNSKIIGITITDLMWNPKYKDDKNLEMKIKDTFTEMISYLRNNGYAILFIPQLFGNQHDKDYMESFEIEGCYTMSDEYDCYFQQYIISKMYALIGMRYHSNIFSAKMGCPFVSVAYEQKMTGFMEKMKLGKFCVSIKDLSFQTLKGAFEQMNISYDDYKKYLNEKSKELEAESLKTTDMVIDYLKKITNE